MTKKDLVSTKIQMTRKINELDAQHRQKMEKLKQLHLELDKATGANVNAEVARIQVAEKMAVQKKEREDANRHLYQSNNEVLVDKM